MKNNNYWKCLFHRWEWIVLPHIQPCLALEQVFYTIENSYLVYFLDLLLEQLQEGYKIQESRNNKQYLIRKTIYLIPRKPQIEWIIIYSHYFKCIEIWSSNTTTWGSNFLLSQFTINFVFTGQTLPILKLNWLIDHSSQPKN